MLEEACREVIYTMECQEFIIMAVAAGIPTLYGLDMKAKPPDKEELLQRLHWMVKKGMIHQENEKFALSSPYDNIFSQMKRADKVVNIGCPEWKGIKCIYMGNENWMVERNEVADNMLRCRPVQKEEFVKIFEEHNCLPNLLSGNVLETEKEVVEMHEAVFEDIGELLQNEACKLVIERCSVLEQVVIEKQIIVKCGTMGYILEVSDVRGKQIREYSLQEFTEAVKEL